MPRFRPINKDFRSSPVSLPSLEPILQGSAKVAPTPEAKHPHLTTTSDANPSPRAHTASSGSFKHGKSKWKKRASPKVVVPGNQHPHDTRKRARQEESQSVKPKKKRKTSHGNASSDRVTNQSSVGAGDVVPSANPFETLPASGSAEKKLRKQTYQTSTPRREQGVRAVKIYPTTEISPEVALSIRPRLPESSFSTLSKRSEVSESSQSDSVVDTPPSEVRRRAQDSDYFPPRADTESFGSSPPSAKSSSGCQNSDAAPSSGTPLTNPSSPPTVRVLFPKKDVSRSRTIATAQDSESSDEESPSLTTDTPSPSKFETAEHMKRLEEDGVVALDKAEYLRQDYNRFKKESDSQRRAKKKLFEDARREAKGKGREEPTLDGPSKQAGSKRKLLEKTKIKSEGKRHKSLSSLPEPQAGAIHSLKYNEKRSNQSDTLRSEPDSVEQPTTGELEISKTKHAVQQSTSAPRNAPRGPKAAFKHGPKAGITPAVPLTGAGGRQRKRGPKERRRTERSHGGKQHDNRWREPFRRREVDVPKPTCGLCKCDELHEFFLFCRDNPTFKDWGGTRKPEFLAHAEQVATCPGHSPALINACRKIVRQDGDEEAIERLDKHPISAEATVELPGGVPPSSMPKTQAGVRNNYQPRGHDRRAQSSIAPPNFYGSNQARWHNPSAQPRQNAPPPFQRPSASGQPSVSSNPPSMQRSAPMIPTPPNSSPLGKRRNIRSSHPASQPSKQRTPGPSAVATKPAANSTSSSSAPRSDATPQSTAATSAPTPHAAPPPLAAPPPRAPAAQTLQEARRSPLRQTSTNVRHARHKSMPASVLNKSTSSIHNEAPDHTTQRDPTVQPIPFQFVEGLLEKVLKRHGVINSHGANTQPQPQYPEHSRTPTQEHQPSQDQPAPTSGQQAQPLPPQSHNHPQQQPQQPPQPPPPPPLPPRNRPPILSRNVPPQDRLPDDEIIRIGRDVHSRYGRHVAAPYAFSWRGRCYAEYLRKFHDRVDAEGRRVWDGDVVGRIR